MTAEKVLFFVHDNLYNSKRVFTRQFAKALKYRGVDVRVIDLQRGALSSKEFKEVFQFKPLITCSFNSILPLADGTYFWDHLEIPHLFFVLDPAIYHLSHTKSPFARFACVDRADCQVIKGSTFFPHAIDSCLKKIESQAPKYEVVFFGSCYDHERIRSSWKIHLEEPLVTIVDVAVEIALGDPSLSFVEAVMQSINRSTLNPHELPIIQLCTYVDNYLRGLDRTELIRSLSNFKIHIFGSIFWQGGEGMNDWSHYLQKADNIEIHPNVPFSDLPKILSQSKVCLNSIPFFKEALHERLLLGLACHCVVVTTANPYIEEMFGKRSGVLTYSRGNWRAIQDELMEFLSNDHMRNELVEKGRKIIFKDHTWDQRAESFFCLDKESQKDLPFPDFNTSSA